MPIRRTSKKDDDRKSDDKNKGGKNKGKGDGGIPAVDTIDRQDLAAQYGWALSVLKSSPDLAKLFDRAVKNSWAPQRFIAELRNTDWFREHSDAMRNFIILKKTDPTTFRNRTNQARASVRDMATEMGAQLSPEALNRIARNVLYFGWNDSQIRDTLAGAVGPGAANTYGGQAATTVEHLRETALNNGVKLADKTVQGWAVRIAAGEDISGFDQYVRGMAKSAFPAWSDRIDAGENVADIAAPYREQMAQTLELNPSAIDLFDPTLRGALQAQTKDGQIASKPLWQFEQELRRDGRFDKTERARTDAAKFADVLSSTFGAK